MLCHAYGKIINDNPSERIRFMYEDPNAPTSETNQNTTQISVRPAIPTSFEGEYYKHEPGQLA